MCNCVSCHCWSNMAKVLMVQNFGIYQTLPCSLWMAYFLAGFLPESVMHKTVDEKSATDFSMPQSGLAQCWIVWDEMSRGVEKWAKMQQKSAKMMLFWHDNYRCSSCVYHCKLDAVGTGSRRHRVRCNVRGIRCFGRL